MAKLGVDVRKHQSFSDGWVNTALILSLQCEIRMFAHVTHPTRTTLVPEIFYFWQKLLTAVQCSAGKNQLVPLCHVLMKSEWWQAISFQKIISASKTQVLISMDIKFKAFSKVDFHPWLLHNAPVPLVKIQQARVWKQMGDRSQQVGAEQSQYMMDCCSSQCSNFKFSSASRNSIWIRSCLLPAEKNLWFNHPEAIHSPALFYFLKWNSLLTDTEKCFFGCLRRTES